MPWRKSFLPALRTPKSRQLTTEVRDQPEEKGQRDAEKKTSDDRKVKRGVFATVHDVAGQFSLAEWELVAEIEKGAEKNEKSAEEEKRAAEFTQGLHELILPEATSKSFIQPCYYYSIPTLDNY